MNHFCFKCASRMLCYRTRIVNENGRRVRKRWWQCPQCDYLDTTREDV